jgi:hypothetical protein
MCKSQLRNVINRKKQGKMIPTEVYNSSIIESKAIKMYKMLDK